MGLPAEDAPPEGYRLDTMCPALKSACILPTPLAATRHWGTGANHALHLREGKRCRPLGTRWAEDLSLGFTAGIARRRDGVASVACLRCWREPAAAETVCRPPRRSSRRILGVSRTLQRAK